MDVTWFGLPCVENRLKKKNRLREEALEELANADGTELRGCCCVRELSFGEEVAIELQLVGGGHGPQCVYVCVYLFETESKTNYCCLRCEKGQSSQFR